MAPTYWKIFIHDNSLEGKQLEIPEHQDLSEIGCELQILNEEQSISESTQNFPGIVAIKFGWTPVAMCLAGSGDYYYININEGKSGAFYRIPHDSVSEGNISYDDIDIVLDKFNNLVNFKNKEA